MLGMPWRRRAPRRRGTRFDGANFMSVGAAIMAAAATFILLGQVTSPTHPAGTDWFTVAAVALVIGFALFAFGGFVGVLNLLDDRRCPLEVVHDPEDVECVQRRGAPYNDVELRVRVRNIGRVGLHHVRGRLAVTGGHTHWLRLEHDNTPPYDRSLAGEVLPADEEYRLYFDVVRLRLGEAGPLVFEYADDSLQALTRTGSDTHEVMLHILGAREGDGASVLPVRKRFRVELLNGGTDVRLTEAT